MEDKVLKISERILFCITCISMFAMIFYCLQQNNITHIESSYDIVTGWYYLENGKKIDIKLPVTIKSTEKELTIYKDNFTDSQANLILSTRAGIYRIKLVVDGKEYYKFEDKGFKRNAQMAGKMYCDMRLPIDLNEKRVCLIYQNDGSNIFNIGEVYIGNGISMLLHHLLDNAIALLFVLIMVVLGIISLVVGIYLKNRKLFEKKLANISEFLFICSIWSFTDSSIMQYLFNMSPIISYISYYAFMLIEVPMFKFIRNTKLSRHYHILDLFVNLAYLNILVQSILNAMGIFEFADMLVVTHLLLVLSVLVLTSILVIEYKKEKDDTIFVTLEAFGAVEFSGILAMILYWLFEITFYEIIFQLGVLLFISLLLTGVIHTMADTLRLRTEMAAYKRLSREDRLTGLKNRRAFEELMLELQKKARDYENIALVFMDLNGLKKMNDTYGHHAGDELIINAAICIEQAFSKLGDCYRIGGDEFCVVIVNPKDGEKEFNCLLDKAIEEYNQNGKYYISIARGVSFIKEGKRLKSVSDWKFEADKKMYENKRLQKEKGWRGICE